MSHPAADRAGLARDAVYAVRPGAYVGRAASAARAADAAARYDARGLRLGDS